VKVPALRLHTASPLFGQAFVRIHRIPDFNDAGAIHHTYGGSTQARWSGSPSSGHVQEDFSNDAPHFTRVAGIDRVLRNAQIRRP
jgi:hypothetical protein